MRLIDANQLYKDIVERGAQLSGCYSAGIARYMDRMLAHVLAEVDIAPTIDAVPRWIPCEERLPKDDEDVLISYCNKEGEGDTSHVYIDITSYGQMYFGTNRVGDYKHWRAPFEYFESNYEVIAWMPLPEPYEGERKDDDTERG